MPTLTGSLPLNALFKDVRQHGEIAFHLLPIPLKAWARAIRESRSGRDSGGLNQQYVSPNPSTQYLRILVSKTIPLMVFGTRVLKYLVLAWPSRFGKRQGQGQKRRKGSREEAGSGSL